MTIKSFLFDRRDAFILRWHARQTQRQETLAEHHYFVTKDAMIIAQALRYHRIANPDLFRVMRLAMVHDAPERHSGDISGEAKRHYPALKAYLRELERHIIEKVLYQELPEEIARFYRSDTMAVSQDEDSIEVEVVKYADKLEAYLFAVTEVEQGNTLMREVVENVQEELDLLQWDWLQELRKQTGLP